MRDTQNTIDELLVALEKLPGIGPKSASRIAYFVLNEQNGDSLSLIESIKKVKDTIHFCKKCFNYSEHELCDICSDDSRDCSVLCVVCDPKTIPVIESSSEYKGLYHVLGGEISPMDGIGPDELRIKELINRVEIEEIEEIILATNPNIEGETTASYIAKKLKKYNIKITRPACGIPYGGELEFADEMTLGLAIKERRDFS